MNKEQLELMKSILELEGYYVLDASVRSDVVLSPTKARLLKDISEALGSSVAIDTLGGSFILTRDGVTYDFATVNEALASYMPYLLALEPSERVSSCISKLSAMLCKEDFKYTLATITLSAEGIDDTIIVKRVPLTLRDIFKCSVAREFIELNSVKELHVRYKLYAIRFDNIKYVSTESLYDIVTSDHNEGVSVELLSSFDEDVTCDFATMKVRTVTSSNADAFSYSV
jgi:hypothetical protein